jgi:bis(5'-nucleosyl)-tetraphosphatase (symmetrical)
MHYAIGDIQGCFGALRALLNLIHFNEKEDTLWLTGDLVNRGPQSLETLRFIKRLGQKHRIVLGNHDLHLLAILHGIRKNTHEDTLNNILQAPDRDELKQWLLMQPLLQYDENMGYLMIHAGLAPTWNIKTAIALSHEVETILQSEQANIFFQHMYGDFPDQWDPHLQGFDRLRCITNYLTRARLCYPDGRLALEHTGKKAKDLIPWFKLANRKTAQMKIIFGHWAALGGITDTPNTFALDTGCVWGFALTAMRLEDGKRFSVNNPLITL